MAHVFDGPLFIIAVDRSGTTLLNLMLDTHPDIAIPYESKFITDYYKSGRHDINYNDEKLVRKLIEQILAEKYVADWDVTLLPDDIELGCCHDFSSTVKNIYSSYAQKRGKRIWGDKDPLYASNIDILHKLFPEAKYILLVRDGRDVANSIMNQWWGPNDFVSCLRYWEKTVTLSRKMLAMLPEEKVTLLLYEDLVRSPEKELRRICDFIDIPYFPEMASNFAENAADKVGKVRLDKHHALLKTKPGSQHIAKWKTKLSNVDQAIAYELVGKTLTLYGYEKGVSQHLFKPARKLYHWFYEYWCFKFSLSPGSKISKRLLPRIFTTKK